MAYMNSKMMAAKDLMDQIEHLQELLAKIKTMEDNDYICLDCGTIKRINHNDRLRVCYCDHWD